MRYYLLILSFIFLSCSVQKRRYQSGYYLTWNSDKESAQKLNPQPETHSLKQSITSQPKVETEAIASKDTPSSVSRKSRDTCGFLAFSDKTEIKFQSVFIEDSLIKYKRCDYPEGPIYIIRKSEVLLIQEPNGKISYVSPGADPKLHRKYLARERTILKKKHKIPQLASVLLSALSIYGLMICFTVSTEISSEGPGVKFIYFLPSLVFAAMGIFLGKRALDKHKTDDEKRKVGSHPKFAIFFGILAFLLSLLFMALLLG